MFRTGVVLVEPDTDTGWVDFHQLAERILQTATDRDRAAVEGGALGKFFAAIPTGGIAAAAVFVQDDVVDVLPRQFGSENFGKELLGLPAGSAIADRDYGELMLIDELDQFRTGPGFLLVAADDVHEGM